MNMNNLGNIFDNIGKKCNEFAGPGPAKCVHADPRLAHEIAKAFNFKGLDSVFRIRFELE